MLVSFFWSRDMEILLHKNQIQPWTSTLDLSIIDWKIDISDRENVNPLSTPFFSLRGLCTFHFWKRTGILLDFSVALIPRGWRRQLSVRVLGGDLHIIGVTHSVKGCNIIIITCLIYSAVSFKFFTPKLDPNFLPQNFRTKTFLF